MSIGGRRQRQHRSWPSTSFNPVREPHVFNTRDGDIQEENEEELIWAAIERLPTFDRIRKGLLNLMLDNGKIVHCPIDFTNLGLEDRRLLLESMLKCVEEDNERLLRGFRDRVNRYDLFIYLSILLKYYLILIIYGVFFIHLCIMVNILLRLSIL
jgi:hypothetical protein